VGFCQQKGHRFERRRSETKEKQVKERSRAVECHLPSSVAAYVGVQTPPTASMRLSCAISAPNARVPCTRNEHTPTNYTRVQPLASLFIHYFTFINQPTAHFLSLL
jgi:hypothetical protein